MPTAQDVSIDAGWEWHTGRDMNQDISDVEDNDSNLSIQVVSWPSHGELTWWGTNWNEFSYNWDSWYVWDDSFDYKVIDSDGWESEVKTVTITNINAT